MIERVIITILQNLFLYEVKKHNFNEKIDGHYNTFILLDLRNKCSNYKFNSAQNCIFEETTNLFLSGLNK